MEEHERPERPDMPEIEDLIARRGVGDMLASERRRQGKSVADIADATRVRGRLIQALENGEWGTLPSPAYVKGYIQNYATALGLSAEPFLEAYRSEDPRPKDGSPEPHPSLGEPILPRREQAHAIPNRMLLVLLSVVAVIALIWITLSLAGGGDAEPAPLPPEPGDEAPVSEPATEAVPGVTAEDLEAVDTPEATAGAAYELTVSVAQGDASWLRVTVDGERVYEGTLGGGESRSWQVSDLATVRIGRPSVVSITRDGEPVEIPSSTELPTVEIPADD